MQSCTIKAPPRGLQNLVAPTIAMFLGYFRQPFSSSLPFKRFNVYNKERTFVLSYHMVSIMPIQTGTAQLKEAQRCGMVGRSAFQRKIDIFRDSRWAGPLPIFCFLIEHPEGRFLVDTGDTARNSVPGYLPIPA